MDLESRIVLLGNNRPATFVDWTQTNVVVVIRTNYCPTAAADWFVVMCRCFLERWTLATESERTIHTC